MIQVSGYASEQEKQFKELSLEEYHRFSEVFEEGVYQVTAERSIQARDVPGGTAPNQVRAALERARSLLEG